MSLPRDTPRDDGDIISLVAEAQEFQVTFDAASEAFIDG